MTGSESTWRQLRDVVGAVIVRIEPAPATAGKSTQQGKVATSR